MFGGMLRTQFALWFALAAALPLSAQNKPRIILSASGGPAPYTVYVMTVFKERCPEVTVTLDKSKADFTVLFERPLQALGAELAVFDKEGDLVFTGSTRLVGNAAKDVCEVIKKASSERK